MVGRTGITEAFQRFPVVSQGFSLIPWCSYKFIFNIGQPWRRAACPSPDWGPQCRHCSLFSCGQVRGLHGAGVTSQQREVYYPLMTGNCHSPGLLAFSLSVLLLKMVKDRERERAGRERIHGGLITRAIYLL